MDAACIVYCSIHQKRRAEIIVAQMARRETDMVVADALLEGEAGLVVIVVVALVLVLLAAR